jgi:hypothetical protein
MWHPGDQGEVRSEMEVKSKCVGSAVSQGGKIDIKRGGTGRKRKRKRRR